jgi:hypothetical protein
MVISILMRKTRITDRGQWESALAGVLPRIVEILEEESGFVSVQYMWGTDAAGEIGQITTWKTLEDCRRYVREGGAATVATHEDSAVPTAPYPDGAWTRQTYDVLEG